MEVFHPGEREVQARAGVEAMASRVGRSIQTEIPPVAAAFLEEQAALVVGSVTPDGSVWASLLAGVPGFIRVLDSRRVAVEGWLAQGDPAGETLVVGAEVGTMAIDLATRRRMRLNGVVRERTSGGFVLEARQVYSNCPKYIQARELRESAASPSPTGMRRSARLSAEQQVWIGRADTFFVATAHPEGGTDASHRGGGPGFVRVVDTGRLAWPDYAGNTMFQTLGNLAVNPRAGLLFLDFTGSRTLQVTGSARIDWNEERAREYPGAERLIDFEVREVVELEGCHSLRWELRSYSPFNPPAA